MMRTTVSIEPDLARQLEQRMATEGKGFKQVLNETLRRGFESQVGEAQTHYMVRSFSASLAPGVGLAKVNLLLYALTEAVPQHAAARSWWEGLMNRPPPSGLPGVSRPICRLPRWQSSTAPPCTAPAPTSRACRVCAGAIRSPAVEP